ncbi:hypothetical protein SMICM304S_07072 [Streptomyces microflavus]
MREAKSLSEEQVAEAVGVTRATVRSWETGRTSPRGRKRALYAKLIAPDPEPVPATRPKAVRRKERPERPAPAAEPVQWHQHQHRHRHRHRRQWHRRRWRPRPRASPCRRVRPRPSPHRRARPCPRARRRPPYRQALPRPPRRNPLSPGSPRRGVRRAVRPLRPRPRTADDSATGRRSLARESVERAFQLAWHRWPEVAVDRDPVGWVRAAAYEYAMSPWHRLRRVHRHPDAPPSEPARRALFEALLDLPPAYRRTLLLYDGVGLDLPETAAETEASTPAAAGRLEVARAAVAERLPELAAAASPAEQSELLQDRLGGLARAEHVPAPSPARTVRTGSEDKARLWTRAAIAFVALLIGATALTLHTAPTHYEQPVSPPERVGGVPPRGGPQKLTPQDLKLQKVLKEQLAHGPERLVPRIP